MQPPKVAQTYLEDERRAPLRALLAEFRFSGLTF